MAVIFRNARIIIGTGEIIRKGLVVLEGPKIRYAGLEKKVALPCSHPLSSVSYLGRRRKGGDSFFCGQASKDGHEKSS